MADKSGKLGEERVVLKIEKNIQDSVYTRLQ
jgi:hypothetical protein